jgi:hypothetical protein
MNIILMKAAKDLALGSTEINTFQIAKFPSSSKIMLKILSFSHPAIRDDSNGCSFFSFLFFFSFFFSLPFLPSFLYFYIFSLWVGIPIAYARHVQKQQYKFYFEKFRLPHKLHFQQKVLFEL